jgi:hypothetical protein
MVEAVAAYDRSFFSTSRERFLRCWLRPEHRAGVALVENDEIQGYAVIRACRTGFKIGPLFADSQEMPIFSSETWRSKHLASPSS